VATVEFKTGSRDMSLTCGLTAMGAALVSQRRLTRPSVAAPTPTLEDMHISQTGLPPRPTIRQAAEYHQVDIKTIRRWIQQGRITAHRVGPRLLRLDRDSVINVGRRIGAA
jgi:excisionase family DNA binding protein